MKDVHLGIVAYHPPTKMWFTGEGRDAPAWHEDFRTAKVSYDWPQDKPRDLNHKARYFFTYDLDRDPMWHEAVIKRVRVTREVVDEQVFKPRPQVQRVG